ncbi:MAG: isocitrate/isopropylmalate family dehydrogenase, partial [Acidobacteriota bacterium]
MEKHKVVVIPGDGIGPEIMSATLMVLEKLDCGLHFIEAVAGLEAVEQGETLLPAKTLDLIAEHRVALKGPLTTPVGGGFSSLNVSLRQHFDLFANLRPAASIPGARSRYEDVDIITVRENTEGLYAGHEEISEDGDRAEVRGVVTKSRSDRILRFAYEIARKRGRGMVTVVHKANILKATSGLFLDRSREIRRDYPEIQTREMIVDNASMQLVLNPHQFDVIVTTNLFGDILSDLCAGLIGGLGLAPGANIGEHAAIFEAVHGSAPDIAGRGIANPTALMLAAALMLDHLELDAAAARLRHA